MATVTISAGAHTQNEVAKAFRDEDYSHLQIKREKLRKVSRIIHSVSLLPNLSARCKLLRWGTSMS
jgi:hypothetical protein